MRAFISFLACLVPLVVFAAEEDAILQTAFRIIAQRRKWGRLGGKGLLQTGLRDPIYG